MENRFLNTMRTGNFQKTLFKERRTKLNWSLWLPHLKKKMRKKTKQPTVDCIFRDSLIRGKSPGNTLGAPLQVELAEHTADSCTRRWSSCLKVCWWRHSWARFTLFSLHWAILVYWGLGPPTWNRLTSSAMIQSSLESRATHECKDSAEHLDDDSNISHVHSKI